MARKLVFFSYTRLGQQDINLFTQKFQQSLRYGVKRQLELSSWLFTLLYSQVEALAGGCNRAAAEAVQQAEFGAHRLLHLAGCEVHDAQRAALWESAGSPRLACLYAEAALLYGTRMQDCVGHLTTQSGSIALGTLLSSGAMFHFPQTISHSDAVSMVSTYTVHWYE